MTLPYLHVAQDEGEAGVTLSAPKMTFCYQEFQKYSTEGWEIGGKGGHCLSGGDN